MIDLRLRNRIGDDELKAKVGKILTPADINVMLTGAARVARPDGSPLCVYLPGAIPEALRTEAYPALHSLRTLQTDNRGLASGSLRVEIPGQKRTRSRSRKVASAIIGSFELTPIGAQPICRLTAWTGANFPQFQELFPLFEIISEALKNHVPERYAAQAAEAARTHPNWVIPGTPFSTVTVNNSYPTGVHTDKGDLDAGFSTIAVLRRGEFSGGILAFPRYRLGVDMQDGDLILMDAHEWHGNTALIKHTDDAERISVVSYFRTAITRCGTAAEETEKARAWADRRSGIS